jgi:hypothetical protein
MSRQCKICKRVLSNPADPLSEDCGGDCLGCIQIAEGKAVEATPVLDVSAVVTEYWFTNYTYKGLCSLCGNSGVIDTTGIVFTNAGLMVGRQNFCICPNGQELRSAHG